MTPCSTLSLCQYRTSRSRRHVCMRYRARRQIADSTWLSTHSATPEGGERRGIRYVSTAHRSRTPRSYAMPVPDMARHTLCEDIIQRGVRYVSTEHTLCEYGAYAM
eukprot:2143462-Rhodomonas_salina.1